MIQICERDKCAGCEACYNACNQKAIKMIANNEGFLYPEIQEDLCTQCGLCRKACPVIDKPRVSWFLDRVFAVKANDDNIRNISASGGFFSIIARHILSNGGVVFGAAYDQDYVVNHIEINCIEELYKLYQSKYAQSRIEHVYSRIRDLLIQGKQVLFSGTPCQVGGLKKYLIKDWDTLITVDLVCHGIPSPDLWQKYIDYRSNIDNQGGKPCGINMRSKKTGWPTYSVQFQYPTGVEYYVSPDIDPYMRAFLFSINLRESCYECQFRGIQRISDFTLGDYWGIWKHMPEFDDHKGTSVVLVHSKKAEIMFGKLDAEFTFRELSIENCIDENPAVVTSPLRPEARDTYYKKVLNSFSDLTEGIPVKTSETVTVKKRIKRFIKAGIKKIIKH